MLRVRRSILSLIIAFAAAASFAQAPPGASDLPPVLETKMWSGVLSHQTVPSSWWSPAFSRTKDYPQKAGEIRISAIRVTSTVSNGVVKVQVSVLRGMPFEREEPVGEYSTGYETVVVSDLLKFGVLPLEFRLIRNAATVGNLPVVSNNTASIQVMIEPVVSPVPKFRMNLKNVGIKAISCFTFETYLGSRRHLSGMPRNLSGETLIEPGSTYSRELPLPLDDMTVSTGDIPLERPGLELRINSVVFSDGSFEGDIFTAADFLALKWGEKTQAQRILELLRDHSWPDAKALETAAVALSQPVRQDEFENAMSIYPKIGEFNRTRNRFISAVRGAEHVKDTFLLDLRSPANTRPESFAAFRATMIKNYERLLATRP